MDPVRVQVVGELANDTTSIVFELASDVQAGNLLIVAVNKYSPTSDAFVVGDIEKAAGTASLGAFSLDVVSDLNVVDDEHIHSAIYSAPITGGGSLSVRVNGGSGQWWQGAAGEWSNVDISATRLEDSSSDSGLSGAAGSGDGTSAASALFIGSMGYYSYFTRTITEDAAFDVLHEWEENTAMLGSVIERITSSGLTDAATWSAPVVDSTEGWTACLAIYKAAEEGGEIPPLGGGDTPGLVLWMLANAYYQELTAAGLGEGLEEPTGENAATWGGIFFE